MRLFVGLIICGNFMKNLKSGFEFLLILIFYPIYVIGYWRNNGIPRKQIFQINYRRLIEIIPIQFLLVCGWIFCFWLVIKTIP